MQPTEGRQLYLLTEGEYSDYRIVALFEGPAGLDFAKEAARLAREIDDGLNLDWDGDEDIDRWRRRAKAHCAGVLQAYIDRGLKLETHRHDNHETLRDTILKACLAQAHGLREIRFAEAHF